MRRADPDPRRPLGDKEKRIHFLYRSGRYEEVLTAVEASRKQMQEIPEPWNVRERILDTAHSAALALKRWQEALALNQEIAQSKQDRRATAVELARARFNDYWPLLKLERYAEARELLLECRRAFEEPSDAWAIGKVLGALADLEDKLGHDAESIHYEQAALRYHYDAGDPYGCRISHYKLAIYLSRGGSSRAALAHRLAAAIIRFQTRDGCVGGPWSALSREMAAFAPSPPPLPANFDELCGAVEQVEGVRLRELFSRLPTENARTGDEALEKVLELAACVISPQ